MQFFCFKAFIGIIASFFCLDTLICQPTDKAKVLLIGIDGCRTDALLKAYSPNIDSLTKSGYSCLESRTVVPTMSGPGWASMLTGVWYTKHNIHGNIFIGNKLQEFPHLYYIIESEIPELKTYSVSHWGPINSKIIDKVDVQFSPKSDQEVAQKAIEILRIKNPDVLFLHFDDIDHCGHFSGFSPNNKKYIEAIEKVDKHIGSVLNALKNRTNYGQEDWLIVLSTDHGGIGLNHGGSTQIERTSFIIATQKDLQANSPAPTTIKSSNAAFLHSDSLKLDAQINSQPISMQQFSLEFLLKINTWKPDMAILSTPFININTHKKDGYSLSFESQNTKNQWRSDTFNNQQWHKIAVHYKQAQLSIYQNDRIVALQKILATALPKESFLMSLHPPSANSSWEIAALKLSYSDSINIKHEYKLKDLSNASFGRFNQTITYNSYQSFPTIVDLTPAILEHLGIDWKKINYWDGQSFLDKKN